MAEKKLKYREVPQALAYVIKTIWGISPSYVLITFFQQIKNRLVPYVTLFIAAAITSRLPALISDHSKFHQIVGLLFMALGIEAISRSLDLLTNRTQVRSEARVAIVMREHFYKRYAELPYYLYEDKDVIDAFNYADTFMYRFSQFGLGQIARSVGSVLEFATAAIALIAVAWYMPLLLFIFLPFLLRSIIKINKENVQMFKRNQPPQRRIWTIERMFYPRYIKETRLYGVVTHFLAERRTLSEAINIKEQIVQFKRDRLTFLQDIELQLAGLVASIIAVWRIAFQGSPLGIFVLAQALTSRAGYAVGSIFTEISTFDEDLYGFSEYRYITEELQSKVADTDLLNVPNHPRLLLKNVSFKYPESEVYALKNITLDLPYGISLAIVGENGAGKTTLTRLLLGLYRPSSGELLIEGKPLTQYSEASWLSKAGVLLQDFGLNEDITIRDAIWIGDINKPRDDIAIWKALDRAELKKTIEALPHKLDTYLGKWIDEEKGTELSGGQLQRLAIARILFRDPEVLILDEPTSAVDANAEERIFGHLQSVRSGKTTIFISHRFSTVRRAEQIIFIEKGKIIEHGTHEELMKLSGKYHAMFTAQAKNYQ
jgi:ATP-binding cassette subfamily B protein